MDSIEDVGPGNVVKFQTGAEITGSPVAIALTAQSLPSELQFYLPPKFIAVTLNSIPQGAELKVDDTEAGITPKVIQATPGKHVLEFRKEGFNPDTSHWS